MKYNVNISDKRNLLNFFKENPPMGLSFTNTDVTWDDLADQHKDVAITRNCPGDKYNNVSLEEHEEFIIIHLRVLSPLWKKLHHVLGGSFRIDEDKYDDTYYRAITEAKSININKDNLTNEMGSLFSLFLPIKYKKFVITKEVNESLKNTRNEVYSQFTPPLDLTGYIYNKINRDQGDNSLYYPNTHVNEWDVSIQNYLFHISTAPLVFGANKEYNMCYPSSVLYSEIGWIIAFNRSIAGYLTNLSRYKDLIYLEKSLLMSPDRNLGTVFNFSRN